ncbi:Gfo/Idh/MocA family protein [Thermodesulfobacteriota bacterium]
MRKANDIRLGIIGCGAIADRYLRVLQKMQISLVAAVDLNLETAEIAKKIYKFERAVKDYVDIMDEVNAVIICLPNYLHSKVSNDFLLNNINVLCEKPMAVNEDEAVKMYTAAKKSEATLHIANIRRYFWANKEIKKLIKNKTFGALKSIIVNEGIIFSWPSKTGFLFDKQKAGGGVLMDLGSHVLDLLLWWLDEFPTNIEYSHDSYGGVEAEATLRMVFDSGVNCEVNLSRIRNLSNTNILKFENGQIISGTYELNKIILNQDNQKTENIGEKNQNIEDYFHSMIENFIDSIRYGSQKIVKVKSVIPSIKLIDMCYANSKIIKPVWL